MPDEWSACGALPCLALRSTGFSTDFRYCNPFTGSYITKNHIRVILRELDRRIPLGHPVGWDFSEIPEKVVGSSVHLCQLRKTLDGWGDAVDDEAEELGGNGE